MLSASDRANLLGLARASIRQVLLDDGSLPERLEATPLTPDLHQPRGAFVSLKRPCPETRREVLRGCIGRITASGPLYDSVIQLAPKAALEDPRFPALAADELALLRIEISVLTVPSAIGSGTEIVIGRDGVQLSRGTARAVFLPQVAVEQRWSREQLLQQLGVKAGLGQDGWRDADLSVFQAEVFSE